MNLICLFSELKEKDVINVCDGRRLGNIVDIEIDTCQGNICAIIVAENCGLFGKPIGGVKIPWCKIQRIGSDAVLVDAGECKECCDCTPPPSKKKNWFF